MVGLRAVDARDPPAAPAARAGACPRAGSPVAARPQRVRRTRRPRAGGACARSPRAATGPAPRVTPVSCRSRAADPAQARGVLVLPVPVARVRPLGEPAVLDARRCARQALGRGAAGRPGLTVLDAGAGTGFTTEGIVAARRRGARDDARPEPAPAGAQRAPSRRSRGCPRVLGDAENLPFADDAFDRYVSAGSIEYWPDPQRGIAEAYRVTRAGRRRAGDRPGPPRQPRRPRARRDVDAVPAADGVHALDGGGRASRDVRGARAGARLVPRRARAVRARGQRRQARAGPSPAARAAPVEDPPVGPAALRRAASWPARRRAPLFVPIAAVLTLRRGRAAR